MMIELWIALAAVVVLGGLWMAWRFRWLVFLMGVLIGFGGLLLSSEVFLVTHIPMSCILGTGLLFVLLVFSSVRGVGRQNRRLEQRNQRRLN